jgi:hypothetical protein
MTEGQTRSEGQPTPEPEVQGQQPRVTEQAPLDTNAIAAAARRDGEESGYSKAAKDLGVSIDEAKEILESHRKRSDAEKTAEQRLSEREGELNTLKEESTGQKKRADRYEKIVKANVDAQLERIGDEAITELLSGFDVAGQFEWLTKHGAKYIAAPEAQEEGSQRRAPDATRKESIPGLSDSNQSFNDILRRKGLSGGVS